MGVLEPIKVVLVNYPEEGEEFLNAVNNPEDPEGGTRPVPFSRELWIDKDDFMEDPPKKYFRLTPNGVVRLKYGYIIKCVGYTKDEKSGEITELQCEYFPESKSGQDTSGVKVKGAIHWVSVRHAVEAEVRMYDRLFTVEDPGAVKEKDFKELLNPDSLKVLKRCYLEPSMSDVKSLEKYQLERKGYFCADADSTPGKPVLNLTVTLRDAWAKIAQKGGGK